MIEDASSLMGIDPSVRRLWLLQILVEKVDPAQALTIAERMEAFIVGSADSAREDRPLRPNDGVKQGRNAELSFMEAAPSRTAEVITMPSSGTERLLDAQQLQAFVTAAAEGVDNTELARRFGLTPRQANGIRLGLTRRNILRRMAKPAVAPRPAIDRATELQLQEAFLRQKAPALKTMEDVVRFLRQRGDIVVRAGDEFLVNSRLTLTPQQLVDRANEKLSQLGQPLFTSEVWQTSPAAAHEFNAATVSSMSLERGANPIHS